MTTSTKLVKDGKKWLVKVYWGASYAEVYGPYRFMWVAKIVAWFFDGVH